MSERMRTTCLVHLVGAMRDASPDVVGAVCNEQARDPEDRRYCIDEAALGMLINTSDLERAQKRCALHAAQEDRNRCIDTLTSYRNDGEAEALYEKR